MSVVTSVKGEDPDGFYSGQMKRPLSIIEENDGDEGDAGTTPDTEDFVNPAPEINTKHITIETKAASALREVTVANNNANGIKKHESKKKPQYIDTSRAKALTCGSKPKSPSSKSPTSPESKASTKSLHFSRNIRIAPKSDQNSKVPPPVAPKPKTPSPSPSKLKSPAFPSQKGSRYFAFQKSPTCSQHKTTGPKTKTDDTQTSEVEVARSMKNIVKRTVSRIESHVASLASTSKQRVKVDPPRRKISKEEVPGSKATFTEKENVTSTPKSNCGAEKEVQTPSSTPSYPEVQKVTSTLTPASPTEEENATNNSESLPSPDKTETATHTQTSMSSSKGIKNSTNSLHFTPTPNKKTEIATDTQTYMSPSKETENSSNCVDFTPTSEKTETATDTQIYMSPSEQTGNSSNSVDFTPTSEKTETAATDTQIYMSPSEETGNSSNSVDFTPTSEKIDTATDTQTYMSPSTGTENSSNNLHFTQTSDKTETATDTQTCMSPSQKTENTTNNLDFTPTSDKTEAPTDIQSSKETENATDSANSTSASGKIDSSTNFQIQNTLSKAPEIVASTSIATQLTNETEGHAARLRSTTESNEVENLTANQKPTQASNEMENTTATQKSSQLSKETKNSTSFLTSAQETNDAESVHGPSSETSTTLSKETENTIAITISKPMESGNQSASFTAKSTEKQLASQIPQLPSSETETSSSNDTEYEDTLRYQGGSSQVSTSESTTPEFTTPPSSPPLPQTKQISNVLYSPLLSSRTSHSSSEITRAIGNGPIHKSGQVLSDGQGLARIREAAESLKLTSSSHLIPKASPSPPSRRVPFSFRQSPKLSHRPFSEAYTMPSLNNAKAKGSFNLNVLSLPSQFSTRGDSGTSDSESEDKSQTKTGEKSRISPRSPFLMPKFHPRRGSYFFKRRISSESLASLSENESTDNAEEPTPISASDFNQLKETADRLHLSTRRPSVLQWRQQYVESPGASGFAFRNGMNGDSFDEKLTSDRKQKIDEALDWLRNELHEMRSQDQILARQLLTIRNDIHQLKLRRCTTEHQELLDDFKLEIEEQQEFSDVLDIPQPIYEDNPLKHIGVTRLNISARRFSAC